MVKVSKIKKQFGDLEVLKGLSLSFENGKITSIVGASGAGKSTLLQIIGTLDKPTSGEVEIDGENIFSKNANQLASYRNEHIGFVFQFHHLLPEFTALENIVMPCLIGRKNQKQSEKRAQELLSFLNLTHRAHHKPSELSGGEQQRVAIARALINQPKLVLADEPSGNLDSNNANDLHKLFLTINEQFNTTFIIVTHNKALADLSHHVVSLKDGNLA